MTFTENVLKACLLAAIPAAAAPAIAAAASPASENIVVTATKHEESINHVPLSIVALPQSALQEQDLRTIQDISRAVPGLFVTSSNALNGAQISIRGVSSALGASTTAVYLDDIPLQKRIVSGSASGSGSPFPLLFDLERVEVLRGPQGTLYGESAEGGAVRFITPTPSLTRFSGLARAELSGTEGAGVNMEAGAAVGGPIASGKLGFRASLWGRKDSGYIDHIYVYTGQTLGRDTNWETRAVGRLSVLWQVTDDLRVTPAFYMARDHFADADSFTENIPAFTTAGSPGLPPHSYGPFAAGPFKTTAGCNIGANYVQKIAPCYFRQPRTTTLSVPSLAADYDFDSFSIHSSTAYAIDVNHGSGDASWGDIASLQGGAPFLYNFPFYTGMLLYDNTRHTFSEELRAASLPNSGPWTWVGGLFFSNQDTHQSSQDYSVNFDGAVRDIFGRPSQTILGVAPGPDGGISARAQRIREIEYAAFGEVNYTPVDDLKVILGLRAARDQIKYRGLLQGPFFGVAVPTAQNSGLSAGRQTDTAVLPKFGLQYDLDDKKTIFATASKGNRVGGVNTGPYLIKCQSTFAALGITGTPATYQPDSLWSYELGAKMRGFGDRVQINASLFYIDWSNVQVTYALPSPCGFSYVANAGGAVSRGGELQGQVHVAGGLDATFEAAYTDAHYTGAVIGPAPTRAVFIRKGDTLPIPKTSLDIGIRYQLPVFPGLQPYLRADYQYQSTYKRGFGPGTSTYNADTYLAQATNFVSLRLGFTVDDAEVALFADNLLNSQDILNRVGGRSCINASCTLYRANVPNLQDTTFRPRTIGVNLNYKY